MKDDPSADMALVGYVARSYKFKTVADYGFDAIDHPSDEAASAALAEASRFVETFATLLGQP